MVFAIDTHNYPGQKNENLNFLQNKYWNPMKFNNIFIFKICIISNHNYLLCKNICYSRSQLYLRFRAIFWIERLLFNYSQRDPADIIRIEDMLEECNAHSQYNIKK